MSLAVPAAIDEACALHAAGRLAEAEARYEALLRRAPHQAQALHLLGVLCWQTGRAERAALLIGRALELEPRHAAARSNLGNVLRTLGRLDEAAREHGRATQLDPTNADFWINRGVVLRELRRMAQAEDCQRRAIALRPASPPAHNNLGNLLADQGRHDEAVAAFERALGIDPGHAEAWSNRGHSLLALGRHAAALASCERALALAPRLAAAHAFRGAALRQLRRHEASAQAFAAAHALDPARALLPGHLLHARLQTCDWHDHAALSEAVLAGARAGQSVALPFDALVAVDAPEVHRHCAQAFAATLPAEPAARRGHAAGTDGRLRIVYVSSDFRDHAVSYLAAGVLEGHDRAAFDVTLLSISHEPATPMTERLRRRCARFVDAGAWNNAQVADWIAARGTDIVVDLNGHTGGSRPGIFLRRPAPLQIHWLGYPGTAGGAAHDVLLADAVVAPPEDDPLYTEQVWRLPGCYLPADDTREIAADAPPRSALGLPDTAFVFCCFNNAWKLTPHVFAIWMRLLQALPHAVLWLADPGEAAAARLRAAAAEAGVDGARLVFAPRVPDNRDHLARLRRADLFLDTLPYNAHTTASDALWAGLPVLSCRGRAFAARVGASLLGALGLHELVADDLADYAARAQRFAVDGAWREALRRRLAAAVRSPGGPFDTAAFVRKLEDAYRALHTHHGAARPPTRG